MPTGTVLQHDRRLARQQVLGAQASFTSHPHVEDWVDNLRLNPARVPPELVGSPAVTAAAERFRGLEAPGLAMLATLAEMHTARV